MKKYRDFTNDTNGEQTFKYGVDLAPELMKVAAKQLGAKVIYTNSPSGSMFDNTDVMVLEKGGKLAVLQYINGTCELCDNIQALASAWQEKYEKYNKNPDYDKDIPLSAFKDQIDDFKAEAKFMEPSDLLNNLHMIFGVGVDDKKEQAAITKIIQSKIKKK